MSQPIVRVFVNFGLVDLSADPFQLDNATYGLLDTGTLGGTEFFDLTYLVKSVSTNRGRSRQLDQFNAGSAVVVFDNSNRDLDPLNEDSQFYPEVLPRVQIKITANGIPIFTGLVVDWNLDYDLTGQDVMTAVCSDDFTILANQAFDAFTPSAELSSDRVTSVLNRPEIEYIGAREIGVGTSTLGAYAVNEGTNVLNYLQLVTKSEQGFFYISSEGALTFKGKDDILTRNLDAVFNDDGTGLPYQSLTNQFGDEFLYNYIVTESPAGGPFIASDLTSQTKYQYQQYVLTDLLNSSASEVENLGVFLLDRYKNPYLRFTGLSSQMIGLTQSEQNIHFDLDLTDICSISKTFPTGTPSVITQEALVSGISHSVTPGSHTIKFTLEPAGVSVVGASSDEIVDGYRVVTWTSPGSFVVLGSPIEVEYLVVGGGGGGGTATGSVAAAGGGGAGGLRTNVGGTMLKVPPGDIPITVGAGGAGGANGNASSIGTLVSVSGGGRGGNMNAGVGQNGGSGGGGASSTSTTTQAGGTGTGGEGNNGGSGQGFVSGFRAAGGGGGAGAAGQNAADGVVANGGNGVSNSITGAAVTYAGGGGGGGTGAAAGEGGSGGGGDGSFNGGTLIPENGTDGLGGGGGGAGRNATAAASGGDGVVIIRWPA